MLKQAIELSSSIGSSSVSFRKADRGTRSSYSNAACKATIATLLDIHFLSLEHILCYLQYHW
ncbi:hypothetical protein LguiB_005340 [Lonicera macranthoides]